jgi:hypothetical protein
VGAATPIRCGGDVITGRRDDVNTEVLLFHALLRYLTNNSYLNLLAIALLLLIRKAKYGAMLLSASSKVAH